MARKTKKNKKNLSAKIFVWILVIAMSASIVAPIIYYIVAA